MLLQYSNDDIIFNAHLVCLGATGPTRKPQISNSGPKADRRRGGGGCDIADVCCCFKCAICCVSVPPKIRPKKEEMVESDLFCV